MCPATRPCRRVVWWRVCLLLWISWFVVCCVGGPLSSMNVARAESTVCVCTGGATGPPHWRASWPRPPLSAYAVVCIAGFLCLCSSRGLSPHSLSVLSTSFITFPIGQPTTMNFPPIRQTRASQPAPGSTYICPVRCVRNRPTFFSRGANPRGMPGLIAEIRANTSKPPR